MLHQSLCKRAHKKILETLEIRKCCHFLLNIHFKMATDAKMQIADGSKVEWKTFVVATSDQM